MIFKFVIIFISLNIAFSSDIDRGYSDSLKAKNPAIAWKLSIVPGLGQIYNESYAKSAFFIISESYFLLEIEKHSHLISKIKGIYGCLFQDSLPAIIEDDFISKLRHKVSDINNLGGVWKTYTAGDKVLLEVHGLSKIGTVIQHSMSDKTRVRILIDFMGTEIKAEVNWFNLTSYESLNQGHMLHNRRRTRGRNRPIKQLTAA